MFDVEWLGLWQSELPLPGGCLCVIKLYQSAPIGQGIAGVSLILAALGLRRTVLSTDLTRVNVQSVVGRRETFTESNHEKLLATLQR